MTPSLTLISHPLCPYVQRVAITLAEKQLSYERININLAEKPAWFLDMSPLGKTPVLRVDQQTIFESAVICEYLEDRFPPALHPTEPLQRARHRAWIEFSAVLLTSIGALYNAPDAASLTQKAAELTEKFARVEHELANNASTGPYFSGQQFSLVDAAFAPVFRYFDVIDTLGDFAIFDHTPALRHWRRELASRPTVQTAVTENYPHLLREFLATRPSELARRIKGLRAVG